MTATASFQPVQGGPKRFPIGSRADVQNAIRAVGRVRPNTDAARAQVRRYIMAQASKLGCSDEIPDSWKPDGTLELAGHASESQVLALAGDDEAREVFIELAGHWKHGWIPVDDIARAIRAKQLSKGGDGLWHHDPSVHGKSRVNAEANVAHALAPKGKAAPPRAVGDHSGLKPHEAVRMKAAELGPHAERGDRAAKAELARREANRAVKHPEGRAPVTAKTPKATYAPTEKAKAEHAIAGIDAKRAAQQASHEQSTKAFEHSKSVTANPHATMADHAAAAKMHRDAQKAAAASGLHVTAGSHGRIAESHEVSAKDRAGQIEWARHALDASEGKYGSESLPSSAQRDRAKSVLRQHGVTRKPSKTEEDAKAKSAYEQSAPHRQALADQTAAHQASANTRITPAIHQGVRGHAISGSDTKGRKVAVFVPGERGHAERARENIHAGQSAFTAGKSATATSHAQQVAIERSRANEAKRVAATEAEHAGKVTLKGNESYNLTTGQRVEAPVNPHAGSASEVAHRAAIAQTAEKMVAEAERTNKPLPSTTGDKELDRAVNDVRNRRIAEMEPERKAVAARNRAAAREARSRTSARFDAGGLAALGGPVRDMRRPTSQSESPVARAERTGHVGNAPMGDLAKRRTDSQLHHIAVSSHGKPEGAAALGELASRYSTRSTAELQAELSKPGLLSTVRQLIETILTRRKASK